MQLLQLNPFLFCRFLKSVGNVMVIVVFSLFAVSMWHTNAAIQQGLLAHRTAIGRFFLYLLALVFNALCGMALWSYIASVLTDPGMVPGGWHPFLNEAQARAELNRMDHDYDRWGRAPPGRYSPWLPRFCRKCAGWKPSRTHHCSVLGRCVLKMDHYCIWVVNTVGLLNYKAFILFVTYSWVACILGAGIQMIWLIQSFSVSDDDTPEFLLLSFAMDAALALSLTVFVAIHYHMIYKNKTSIEMWEKDAVQPWPFDKGWRRNFEEIFGKGPDRWFIPNYNRVERDSALASELDSRLVQREVSPEDEPPV